MNLPSRLRVGASVAAHVAMAAVANLLAFLLRFDGQVPAWAVDVQLQMLPWLLAARAVAFAPFGLYRGLWRYAGIWDLRNIMFATALSSGVFWLGTLAVAGGRYPQSIIMIDALLVVVVVGGARLAVRLFQGTAFRTVKQRGDAPAPRTVLIYGAGDAGASIVRDIRYRGLRDYTPVGFIDDDSAKVGEHIHGVPVLGTRHDLRRVVADKTPDEILLAMPATDPSTIRGIVRALEPFNIRITSLPNLREILDGTVTVSHIRHLKVEDLLPRVAVGIDEAPLRLLLAGRRVMVTGAGGSIGSELCQQIIALKPESLVLYERSENSLYAITNALADAGATGVHPALGDITDVERLDRTLAQYRPEIIFHAAAHKHVPLMEAHPCEAVKNNVMGTRLLAEAAQRHGVARFILISTDKAVNPTSVMGVTKRIAELIVMTQPTDGATTFLAVRFGNVLGSNGSAIPRFVDQIKSGGPVTITHPDMRRYFMLLPEAAQLVLHVAGRGRRGGVYVLDMGEQIKVIDMARTLIRLSGYVPDEDIELKCIGMRPGEKLFEELVGAQEHAQPSAIEKVFEVASHGLPASEWVHTQVQRIERLARRGDTTAVTRMLSLIVPEYSGRHWDLAPVETPGALTAAPQTAVGAGAA